MVDPIVTPPHPPVSVPAPLPTTVNLNPPMVGTATPFLRVDGQNRDLILESIRAWASGPLFEWAGSWQRDLSEWLSDSNNWLDSWNVEVVRYVQDVLGSVIDSSIELQAPVVQALTGEVSVATFGAVGDGSDVTAQIKNAIAYAVINELNVYIPEGDYLTTETIDVPAGVSVRGAGRGITQIRSTLTSSPIFRVGDGSLGATAMLAANATPGTSVIQLAGSTTFSPGDYLILGDNTLPVPERANLSGELIRVAGISGNLISLESPVRGTYVGDSDILGYTLAASAQVTHINIAPGASITGMSIVGNPNGFGRGGGILLKGVSNCTVYDVEISSLGGSGINVSDSHIVSISNVYVHDLADEIANGRYGYGINVSGVSNLVTISDYICERVRHAFTSDGGAIRGVPSGIKVNNAIARDINNAAFDTHAAGLDIEFNGCSATDSYHGFSVRAKRVTISNCKSVRSVSDGLIFWVESRWVSVDNMTIQASGRHGVNITAGRDILIKNSQIDGTQTHGIRITNDSGKVSNIKLHYNELNNIGLAASSEGIYATPSVPGLSIMYNQVSAGAGMVRSMVHALTSDDSVVVGNVGAGLGYAGNPSMRTNASAVVRDNAALDLRTSDSKLSTPVNSSVALENIGSNVNLNKRIGMCVFNSTTRKPVWATGSETHSTWVDAQGVTMHTPV